jgi:hypothetical protein
MSKQNNYVYVLSWSLDKIYDRSNNPEYVVNVFDNIEKAREIGQKYYKLHNNYDVKIKKMVLNGDYNANSSIVENVYLFNDINSYKNALNERNKSNKLKDIYIKNNKNHKEKRRIEKRARSLSDEIVPRKLEF